MAKIKILNIPFDNVTLDEAVGDVLAIARRGKPGYVVTPNAEIGESCFSDGRLLEAVTDADYVLPDGAGVVLASRILGCPLKGKVAGYDLARALLPEIRRNGMRLFLLGSAPGVAEKAADNIRRDFPGIDIAGVHDGYFKKDEEVIPLINSLKVDVLYVGLGFPKQEIWMRQNRDKLQVGVMLGLGGTLDGIAGLTKRAPEFFIRLNLEWLYRLFREPTRFGRMLRLPKYIRRAVAVRLFRGGHLEE